LGLDQSHASRNAGDAIDELASIALEQAEIVSRLLEHTAFVSDAQIQDALNAAERLHRGRYLGSDLAVVEATIKGVSLDEPKDFGVPEVVEKSAAIEPILSLNEIRKGAAR
jgi:hypothetical protein